MQDIKKSLKIFFVFITLVHFNITSVSALSSDAIDAGKIDEYILESMKQGSISALTLSIVSEDQILYQKVYQTKEFSSPLNLDTPFYIGSIGKSFTALAIKQLSNRGLIDMEANVSEYLPWFTLKDRINKEIKIRNLINHSSGLTNVQGNLVFTYQSHFTIETLTKAINEQLSLKHIAGSIIEYSNLNYVVLGAIIESVTGLSYEEYVKQNIYIPLDMHNTYHSYRDAKDNGLLPNYRIINGLALNVNVPHPNGQVSAGYQMSSTHDMTNYLLLFLNQGYFNGQSYFLNNALSSTENEVTYSPYWEEIDIPIAYFGHSGATFSSTSEMIINQNERIGILVLTNARDVSSKYPISASSISEGVITLLRGVDPELRKPDFNWAIFNFNALVILSIILDIFLSIRLTVFTKKNRYRRRVVWGILDGFLPICILFLSPTLYQSNWWFMLNASPEFTLGAFVGSIILIIIFITRIYYHRFNKKRAI
jgi:CubicO group peptidase (beta-lactamase class C family)